MTSMLRKPVEYEIDAETGCWVWVKARKENGYAIKKVAGKCVSAHRWYWKQANGPIPEGLTLDHLCRNRLCVNPDHMEAVSNAVNVQRGSHTKLTREIVKEIRASSASSAALARRYNVGETAIYNVRSGATWKDER